jgi:ribosomal protein S3AE
MKNLVLISCNDSACTRMKYIFFTDSRSSKVVIRECRTKINEVIKAVPKGAQRMFFAQKSFLRECRAKIDEATKSRSKGSAV